MTHVRTPRSGIPGGRAAPAPGRRIREPDPGRVSGVARAAGAARAAGIPAPVLHPPAGDAASLADLRYLADEARLPACCPHEPCRRAGRCRGPRAAMSALPELAMPACLAGALDTLYAPVARWDALMDRIVRLAELASEPGGAAQSGGTARGATKRPSPGAGRTGPGRP